MTTSRHFLLAVLGGLLLSTSALAQPPQGDDGVWNVQDEEQPPGATEGDTQVPAPPVAQPATPANETACDDRTDDDGDGLADCADADCFDAPNCQAGGSEERSNLACSDWVDNDGDGAVDCDDQDCNRPDIRVCQGSDRRQQAGGGSQDFVDDDIPELGEGMTVEDLIGTHGDADGERNDYLCSDGVDNDNDGRMDCADFGCRFDPNVAVCQGSPNLRFSVVAGIGMSYDFEEDDSAQAFDAGFTRLQLRAFGPMPFIENSFFLISMRVERSPRVTFAHFQIPVGNSGHFFSLNSGSGNLSSGLITSASKQLLLDAPFYVYNAFEQGNGAAAEFGGPITDDGMLAFRLTAAAGSGESTGNVGGRFFRSEDQNFNWTVGGQLGVHFVGVWNRFDNPFLYTSQPLNVSLFLGIKYDQRSRERYPAWNTQFVFRYWRLLFMAENYTKRELEFGAWQTAWNARLGFLIVPKLLLFAADAGQFLASDFDDPVVFDSALRRPLNETQFRAALHLYFYRNIGIVSALYAETHLEENPDRPEDPTVEREFRLEAQFRF